MSIKKYFKKINKFNCLLVLLVIIFVVSVAIPTLSRFKNRTSIYQVEVWDGSVADSFRSGSGLIDDPYIISNGSEFAFFINSLADEENNFYEGKYIELNSDIVLNNGVFSYDGQVKYLADEDEYIIEPYSDIYGENQINKISPLSNFKGNLNGNSYRIYGLYITSSSANELALFNNLSGNISNLYIENYMIYGGYNTSTIAINSDSSNINNVLLDGYVLGKNEDYIYTYELDDIDSSVSGNIELSNSLYNGNKITSILNGTYTRSEGVSEFKINGEIIGEGEFSVNLENDEVIYEIVGEGNIILSNLKHVVTTDNSIAASYIVNASNTNFKNTINKSYVYSKYKSSGYVINSSNNLEITNSYNNGIISSSNAVSFINNIINGEVNINNSYDNGNFDATNSYSFVDKINNSTLYIDNSFSLNDIYAFGKDNGSIINITNSYLISDKMIEDGIVLDFNIKNVDEIKNKYFINNTLLFNNFISIDDVINNPSNVWVVKDNEVPILFIDDLNRPIANLNLGMFSWNNLSYDLNTLSFSSKFIFNITPSDGLTSIKNIYYYIANTNEALTLDEINNIDDWIEYKDIVSFARSGEYIIYVKIVDDNDNNIYINSDILSISDVESIISARIDDREYKTLKTEYNHYYIDSERKIIVYVDEEYTDLENVYYYITNAILTEEELSNLEEEDWILYNDGVSINNDLNNIVYFRAKDNTNFYSYISTDYITLRGYEQSNIIVGRELIDAESVNITSNSSIKLNYIYKDNNTFNENDNHVIISNKLLPENTKMTLIDNKINKVYVYKTNSSDYGYSSNNFAKYEFSLFEEIGKASEKTYFDDNNYVGSIDEDFTLILDFNDINIDNSYNDVEVYLQVIDDSSNVVKHTVKDSIKKFSLYNTHLSNDISANLGLSTTFNQTIEYNKDYENIIPLSFNLKHYSHENIVIYDSTFEDKSYGIELSIYNKTEDKILDKNSMKNVKFMINEKSYHPYSNGIVNINVGNQSSVDLKIQTYSDTLNISDGEYYFKLCPYSSYSDNYDEVDSNKCILIPLLMENKVVKDYNFDVSLNEDSVVISKGGIKDFNFKMLQLSNLDNPNIRVSLYKKKELTAYNQSYDLIDLGEYIENDLDMYSQNVYYLSKNATVNSDYIDYALKLNTELMELNGYKLLFELYDEDIKIGSIEKKFIVKLGGN